MSQFEAVIGLEVHCQLSTASKAFSAEPASFQSIPNRQVDPLSLGHPGTLPVYNERAVELTLKMGLATRSTIHQRSFFARKHYFYPDLPKGYQISQYDRPICTGGYVEIALNHDPSKSRQIRLTRIHLEEDAGKSVHDPNSDSTYLDFNRSGVPLIEIVTEPEIRTPREAYKTMRKIRQLVRYLDICDGNMENGSLRCDANISIRTTGSLELGQKAEIKNINSFRFLERALNFEIERQVNLLENGLEIEAETRLWDEKKGETRSMRSKEGAHDYRYFPDPDLPPLIVSDAQLSDAKNEMTSLPDERIGKYLSEWELPFRDAEVLTSEREIADYFEECVLHLVSDGNFNPKVVAKSVANFIMTHALETLTSKDSQRMNLSVDSSRFSELIAMRLEDRISSTVAVEIFEHMLNSPDPPDTIAKNRNLLLVQDSDKISRVVQEVLTNHPENVASYRDGKVGLMGFFIGEVISKYPGSPDPKIVRALLDEKLGSSN